MIASVFIGFAFILLFQISNKTKTKSMFYLNLVVLFFTLNNFQIVLLDNFFTNSNYFIRNLLFPFYSLIVPSFYAFVRYYLNVQNKTTSYFKFYFILFSIQVLVRFLLYPFYYTQDKCYLIAQYSQIEEIINAILSLFLFVKSFQLIFKKKELFPQILTFDNLNWLRKFLFLGSVILFTWLAAIVFNLDKVVNPQIFIYYPLRVSSSILLFWLGFQGIFNQSLLLERIELRDKIKIPFRSFKKVTTDLQNVNSNKFKAIESHIIENSTYLNPNYSLEKLATELKMSASTVSKIINNASTYNFSDYVNYLRVQKSKEYLSHNNFKHYTIISIGLECGFNSKSTFYKAFKKFTNTTPTNYRIQNRII
jgi:AraC-like DNA-binding protein